MNGNNCLFFFLFIFLNIKANSQELSSEIVSQMVDPTVVTIDTFDSTNKIVASGSGVIITSEGHILTNYHVFRGAITLKVTNSFLNRFFTTSNIIFSDIERDILIIKIDATKLQSIKLGNSEGLKKGQTVFAMGSPFGLENTFTKGIISGFRTLPSSAYEYHPFIQHDAAISPGNSGGALVNASGELIGINTSISKERDAQNINYAIPINDIKKILNYNNLSWMIKGKKESSIFTDDKMAYTPPEKYVEKEDKKISNPAGKTKVNPYGEGNGLISVWTNCSNCILDVWVDDEYIGKTSSYFTQAPVCGQNGTLSKVVAADKKHYIRAKDKAGTTWTAEVFVFEGRCTLQLFYLTKSTKEVRTAKKVEVD